MSGVLLYVAVVAVVVTLSRGGRRAGSEIGLVVFSGVTWGWGVTMVSYSSAAGAIAGGLAALVTAAATAPRSGGAVAGA